MASVCTASEESSSVGIVSRRDASSAADETADELRSSEVAEIVRNSLSEHLLESDTMYSCQDMLTCGNCHLEFALSDIVKFINHKVISCSKGNCRSSSKDSDENEDGIVDTLDADAANSREDEKDENIDPVTQSCTSVRKQTPSIITSSHRHKLKFLQGKGHHQQHVNNSRKVQVDAMRTCSPTLVRSSGKSPSTPGVKQTVDAHTNTMNTEPISITCSSCKQVFSSSWVLLQHAQSVHGSKLYIDILNNEPSILPPIDGQTPGVPTVGGNLSSGINNSMGSSPLTPTHPALSLLRMPLHDRQFPASFLAAAAAAASRPIGASGAGASHSDIFSSASPSVLNHHHPVASLFADAHNLFSAAAASDTHSTRSSSGSRSVTGSSSLPPASGHQSSSITAFEPHLDFYSQRLRQLAGATSPGAARSSVSPVRKHTPPSYSSSMSSSANTAPNSSTVTITTTNTCDILGNSRASLSQQPPSSPKHKSCEFCGKTFRFMSNLIVHRRSHTGEKPYKCNICNHACTQASKLKRHMKTHLRSSQSAQCLNNVTSENTTDSTQSQPDSTGGTPTSAVNNNNNNNNVTNATTNGGDIDMDDEEVDDDDDEEDDDEEECGDEERDEEAADGDNSSVEMVAEDLSTSGGTEKKTNGMGRKSKESSKGMTAAEATTVQSLIGEVMENFGLSGIQQYNEAYKQALEERIKGGSGMGVLGSSSGSGSTSSGVKQERPSSSSSHVSSIAENGGSINSLLKQHQSPLLSHPNLSDFVGPLGACVQASNSLVAQSGLSSAFDHHNPFDPKRLKLDMVSAPSEPRDSLYAGLWLPSLANPFTTPFAHLSGTDATSALAAEMSRSKAISESAFNKSSTISSGGSPRPGPSLGSTPPSANRSSPSGATSGTSPTSGRKESGSRTRNDTCEYCGKVFKNCSNLTVHRRSHTGEKPYKCELCSYACAQSSKLTRHMKTHGRMGKDVYRCRFCDMPFSVPSTLEKHMRKCVVNQNNASGNASNLQLLPCLTSNASNSNDPGSDT